jgi:hypothetical protein
MPLDPHEFNLVDAADLLRHVLSLVDQCENLLNQVLVLHRLAGCIEPAIGSPFDEPLGHAFYRIVAVSVYGDGTVPWSNLEGTLYGGEFGALIRLASTGQRLGQIPGYCISTG